MTTLIERRRRGSPTPSYLPLAIDIADSVSEASEEQSSVDVEAKAKELLDQHPEADATPSNVEEALRE